MCTVKISCTALCEIQRRSMGLCHGVWSLIRRMQWPNRMTDIFQQNDKMNRWIDSNRKWECSNSYLLNCTASLPFSHASITGTTLYCLVRKVVCVCVCVNMKAERPAVEPRPLAHKSSALTITPPCQDSRFQMHLNPVKDFTMTIY